jgi:hypothetical protein
MVSWKWRMCFDLPFYIELRISDPLPTTMYFPPEWCCGSGQKDFDENRVARVGKVKIGARCFNFMYHTLILTNMSNRNVCKTCRRQKCF